jgi:hypothetical protein
VLNPDKVPKTYIAHPSKKATNCPTDKGFGRPRRSQDYTIGKKGYLPFIDANRSGETSS